MATVKKPMAKKAMMMKKSASKKAAASMMSPAMGHSPIMKKGGKVKKAASGYSTTSAVTTKKPTPTYKNLPMGVQNEYYQITGENRGDLKPTARDSARYRGGFEQGLKLRGQKNIKAPYGEQNIEKMGRWEGQNTPQKKKGGAVKKKMQAGGVAGKSPKAPMVDPKGAYTKVQMRTLGNMKKGGKMSKKK